MDNQEIMDMLAVIYKRIDDLEHEIKGGSRSAPLQTYLNELRRKASNVQVR